MAILNWNDLAEKQLISTALFAIMFFATSLAMAQDNWSLEEKIDELTDNKIAVASLSTRNTGAYIRCQQSTKRKGKFEVYFVFGEYLNTKRVPIRYRIDKGTLVEDKWWPSAKGTGVFVSPGHGAEIARQMMRGSKMIVEATNFRGQRHRVRFGLAGASKAIEPVLQLCSISRIALHEKMKGLRKEISLEIELWGPKNIRVKKKILSVLGAYEGAINENIDNSFALSVQKFYDAKLLNCKKSNSPEAETNWCWSFKTLASLKNPPMPSAGQMIYEAAPNNLKKEAGKLYIGD